MTSTSVVILAGVAAAHLGLAVYLYSQHFTPSRTAPVPDPAPMIVEIPKLAPQTRPAPARKLQPRTLPVHVEQRVAVQQSQRVLVQPPVQTRTIDTSTPPVFPTVTTTPDKPAPAAVIGDPHWLSRPSADELAGAYPERALEFGKSGQATLACTVTASGALTGCSVAEETPAGWGFGAAAMKLVPRFRLSPRTEDGRPVGGALVRIPIEFALQG